jgi:site-specific DNA-methyltransferase (adenine-specific)
MKSIPDQSIDMCLTDPPYGTTACKWDTVIPFEPMWEQLHRIVKPNGAICLFGGPPFGATLISSNLKYFRYDWIWQKTRPANFSQANKQPMKDHESINVFYRKLPFYNPIKEKRKGNGTDRSKYKFVSSGKDKIYGINRNLNVENIPLFRFPSSIQLFTNIESNRYHPTQKPVPLLEYLIKTYTLEGETVLDFTMGSGSTGVAAKNLNRNFIGIEKDEKYFEIAKQRIEGNLNNQ